MLFRQAAVCFQDYWFLYPLPGIYFSEEFCNFVETNTSPFFRLRFQYFSEPFDEFFVAEFTTEAFFVVPAAFLGDILFELEASVFQDKAEQNRCFDMHQLNADGKIHLMLNSPL